MENVQRQRDGSPGGHSAAAREGAPSRRGFLAAALVGLVLLLTLRAPHLLWNGRIYAEEGSYLSLLAGRSVWEALTFRWPGGYYVVHLNVLAVLARAVPVYYVAPLFQWAWVAAMTLPLWVVYAGFRGRVGWWFLCLPLVVAFAQPSGEVWMNNACGQFGLSLTAGLLAAVPTAGLRRGRRGWGSLLAFCGMSGPAATLLAPVFALRAVAERSGLRWAQCGVLVACGVVQVVGLRQTESRARPGGVVEAASVVAVKQFAVPLFGQEYAWPAVPAVSRTVVWRDVVAAGTLPTRGAALSVAMPVVLYGGLLLLGWAARERAAVYAVLAAGCMVAGSMAGSLGSDFSEGIWPVPQGRYYYAPNALILFALLLVALRRRARGWLAAPRVVAGGLFAWMVVAGAVEYTRPQPYQFGGASWFEEVGRWERNPERAIEIAPPGVRMHLPKR